MLEKFEQYVSEEALNLYGGLVPKKAVLESEIEGE